MKVTHGLRAAVVALAVVTITSVSPVAAYADTVADYQKWYLDALRIDRAHQISQGAGVVVAVVDTGVDATVAELRGQVLPGLGVTAGAARDGRRDSGSEIGHGTSMAGIIAGLGGSDARVLGIAPKAKILPIATEASRNESDVAKAIRWAADNGADVLNLSLGADRPPEEVEVAAVQYALSKNVVVVAAAGNRARGFRGVESPASIPGVIAVGVTMKSGEPWFDGITGPEMVLNAPAEQVIAPVPRGVTSNGYSLSTGSSSATALVSGVAALVRARYPDADAATVVNRLIRTADDRGAKGRDNLYGFGVVDPVAALTADVPAVSANPLLAAVPAVSGAAGATGAAKAGEDDPAVSISVGDPKLAALQIGVCLAVVALVVGVILFSVRSSRRRNAAPPPAYPYPPAGYPPPPVPPQPGYQQQPGYHQQPGHQQPGHQQGPQARP
jgi:type VII secretion-associated serine protease mycosin